MELLSVVQEILAWEVEISEITISDIVGGGGGLPEIVVVKLPVQVVGEVPELSSEICTVQSSAGLLSPAAPILAEIESELFMVRLPPVKVPVFPSFVALQLFAERLLML